ncbi:MAG: hypothetical protein SGBAC_002642 [Bacillariaceae sp.]
MPPLHPETRDFLNHAAQFLDCRYQLKSKYYENNEFQQIARLYVQTDSGGIETDALEYKRQYQQQSTAGTPVNSFEELYEAANIANVVFKDTVMRLADRARKACGDSREILNVEFPRLKGRERALEKSDDDYMNRTPGPAVSWLYDIVRASIEFASVDQIAAFLELVKADGSIHIVQAKNRFEQPGLSGYRDLVLHVQISTLNGFEHVCEIQIHHKEMKKLGKELKSKFYYEFFRSYLAGGEDKQKDRLNDLEAMTGEAVLDEHSLGSLLQQPMDVSEINRFITLFSDHLDENEWAMRFCVKLLWREMNKNGPSTVNIANAYDKLGQILQKTYCGQMDEEALQLHMRSLRIKKKELGKTYIAVAHTHENIALVYLSRKDPSEAMKYLQEALEIKTRTLGEDHLSVAETYDHMIAASLQLNRITDVVELCHRLLRIRCNSRVGNDHPDLADIYRVLAGAFLRQSKYYDALENYERSLEIRKKLIGVNNDNHESLLEDYKGIFHVQFQQGRLNRVQELHQRISCIRMKISRGKWTNSLPGKRFIKNLKALRVASAPFCFCANGFWCRRISSMRVCQKNLKGCFVDEAFEGVDTEDALSDYLNRPHLCVV